MAYVTEIDIFVYEFDPLIIRVCERGPHVRGVLCVHKEYDMSAKLTSGLYSWKSRTIIDVKASFQRLLLR